MNRELFELEFIFKASPAMLYNFLGSAEGLVRWFCDTANVNKEIYDFYWDGVKESATLIESEEDHFLRFTWDDSENKEEYFEYEMYKSPITNETILKITDFSDADEVSDQIELWESQIDELRKSIGG